MRNVAGEFKTVFENEKQIDPDGTLNKVHFLVNYFDIIYRFQMTKKFDSMIKDRQNISEKTNWY